MNWRPLSALQGLQGALQGTETLYVYPPPAEEPYDIPRSIGLAEALARLEAATRLRDSVAVSRILTGLSTSEDGQWLLRQCAAAGLREVATVIGDTPEQGGRSAGAA